MAQYPTLRVPAPFGNAAVCDGSAFNLFALDLVELVLGPKY